MIVQSVFWQPFNLQTDSGIEPMPYESDPIARKLNELVSSQDLYMGLLCFEALNPGEQVLVGTWELVNEVYNGGFLQYFRNSSGDHAKPMIQRLRLIEANRAAGLLEEAHELIGPGTRWGDGANLTIGAIAIPEQIRKRVKSLERAFYDELDSLHRLVFGYLSTHRDEIDAPSGFWTESATK